MLRLIRAASIGVGLATVALAGAFDLTVVHVNDTHSHLEPTMIKGKPYGGFARLSTLFSTLRAKEKNPIFLHGGDIFQGTIYYNVYKGLADGHLMNLIGFDAVALGNHEFDDGPEGLIPFLRQTDFAKLCANADFSAYPEIDQRVAPTKILNIKGTKVGLIGLITPDLPFISNMGKVQLFDLDASITRAIAHLESQGVKIHIAVSHCGYAEEIGIAKRHPKLDVIVGGHSHSLLGDTGNPDLPKGLGEYPTKVGPVLLVQAWEWAKVAGRMRLTFNREGVVTKVKGDVIPLDESIAEDPKIVSALQAFEKPILALKQSVVGNAPSEITRKSGVMGNLISDAMLMATKPQGAQIALMNSGGMRGDLDAGPITYSEAISVQPFGNTLVLLDLSGAELIATLEAGVRDAGPLQVSKGFRYVINGQSVAATFEGTPIDPSATYRVVTNNFMARGGDKLTALAEAKGRRVDTGIVDLDALIAYLRASETVELDTVPRIVQTRN